MTTAHLAGIARHDRPKGPMETIDRVAVTVAEGVHGDYRGALAATKPSRKRQVTLIEAESVSAAMAESGAVLDWSDCRRNLLLRGIRLPRAEGTRVRVGDSLVRRDYLRMRPVRAHGRASFGAARCAHAGLAGRVLRPRDR